MRVAVDFDNALELAHRLDDGRVYENKEVAKGTGARGGQSVEGSALDEMLVDDGVHAVGRLSGLAQVLDAKVIEGEKALDVLDGVLQKLRIFEESPVPFCILLFGSGKSFLQSPQSQFLLLNLFAQIMGLVTLGRRSLYLGV